MKELIPRFESDRLILRAVFEADIPSYEKHFVNYKVISHLSDVVPWPYPSNGVRHFLETEIFPNQGRDRWMWGIFLKTNPSELIGCVDLWRKGKPENRGFWLGESFWRKGIMTEAVCSIMDYAFNSLGFEGLVFSNAVGNLKSRRIKEKTGARLIGTRPAKFVNPQFTEAETWEITKDEWIRFKLRTGTM